VLLSAGNMAVLVQQLQSRCHCDLRNTRSSSNQLFRGINAYLPGTALAVPFRVPGNQIVKQAVHRKKVPGPSVFPSESGKIRKERARKLTALLHQCKQPSDATRKCASPLSRRDYISAQGRQLRPAALQALELSSTVTLSNTVRTEAILLHTAAVSTPDLLHLYSTSNRGFSRNRQLHRKVLMSCFLSKISTGSQNMFSTNLCENLHSTAWQRHGDLLRLGAGLTGTAVRSRKASRGWALNALPGDVSEVLGVGHAAESVFTLAARAGPIVDLQTVIIAAGALVSISASLYFGMKVRYKHLTIRPVTEEFPDGNSGGNNGNKWGKNQRLLIRPSATLKVDTANFVSGPKLVGLASVSSQKVVVFSQRKLGSGNVLLHITSTRVRHRFEQRMATAKRPVIGAGSRSSSNCPYP
jgi:hypothetical protein